MKKQFDLQTTFKLTGDQGKVINELSNGIKEGLKYQTLLGVTGSGKTFCMANIIKEVNKPTLIISHNKTLAAQLYSELKELFPNNAVEYFVSHYKYFQPEAYVPSIDKYIEKSSMINDDIEMLRQRAAVSLCTRKDVIIVASVSALFGLGNPDDYKASQFCIKNKSTIDLTNILIQLTKRQYERTNDDIHPGTFKVVGDTIYIMLSINDDIYYRLDMFDNDIEHIYKMDLITDKIIEEVDELSIFPISTYYLLDDQIDILCKCIQIELEEVYENFIERGENEYANRIYDRCMYDVEMLQEVGWVKGIEVYQRYLTNREPGKPPYTLIDFFPKDYLMFIDESHATIPQIKSISSQGYSIKENLIKYGWRLPSSVDNRPVNFIEFVELQNQVIFVSATPGDYELKLSDNVSEQIIRPTGLLDPEIEVRPIKGQIDNIIKEVNQVIENKGKVLITVLSQKMAEDLADYLREVKIKACYLHANVPTLDRIDILNGLQQNQYDVLIGCNLLREGLSISNCQLVIILDADKEGFLRNYTSLMQTIGRAARNVNGRAILYADKITKSMQQTIDETNRHRTIQMEYNQKHHITPQSTKLKLIKNVINDKQSKTLNNDLETLNEEQIKNRIKEYKVLMENEAKDLNFEMAVKYRDSIKELEFMLNNM